MPYCCASNVKAAFVNSIILAVLYTLEIIGSLYFWFTLNIIAGYLGLVSASILFYGAHTRNSKAIQIYKISGILMIIFRIVETILEIVTLPDFRLLAEEKCKDLVYGTNDHHVCFNAAHDTFKAAGIVIIVVFVFFVVGFTIFNIWTIFVANNAKLEIEGEPFSFTDKYFGLCCCCASNLKAAFVNSIILAVLYIMAIVGLFYFWITFNIILIITGFLGLVSASILAYGAHTGNSKAVQIYKVSAILMIILFIVETILALVNLPQIRYLVENWAIRIDGCINCYARGEAAGTIAIVVFALFFFGFIILKIWTIFVANNARLEIEGEPFSFADEDCCLCWCCTSYIKAAFVNSIILAVLYALKIIGSFYFWKTFGIITGFLGLLSVSILVL